MQTLQTEILWKSDEVYEVLDHGFQGSLCFLTFSDIFYIIRIEKNGLTKIIYKFTLAEDTYMPEMDLLWSNVVYIGYCVYLLQRQKNI